jgi:hypothetical protein
MSFPLSCRTSEGVEDWLAWIEKQTECKRRAKLTATAANEEVNDDK